jgi:hypothetical protein
LALLARTWSAALALPQGFVVPVALSHAMLAVTETYSPHYPSRPTLLVVRRALLLSRNWILMRLDEAAYWLKVGKALIILLETPG